MRPTVHPAVAIIALAVFTTISVSAFTRFFGQPAPVRYEVWTYGSKGFDATKESTR